MQEASQVEDYGSIPTVDVYSVQELSLISRILSIGEKVHYDSGKFPDSGIFPGTGRN